MDDQTGTYADLAALEGDYEILSELGRGGISVVYRAREREVDREVAIKIVRNQFLEDPEARVRIDREARMLARLHHPNIVTLLGARRLPDGRLALITQLAHGRTLRAAVEQRGPFPVDEAIGILRQVASALSYIHERGIVHRDVKPENIFLEADGQVLLSDLGIAKASEISMSVTLTGVVIGTPTYMSPEQIDGATLDGRSDLYSLGLVGYEMLTGQRPWAGENLYSVIFKQKNESLPPLDTLRPDVPGAPREAIERAMAKSPDDRWAGLDEFVRRLDGRAAPGSVALVPGTAAALPAAAVAAVLETEPGVPARRPARSRTPAVAAGIAIIAVTGGMTLALSGPTLLQQDAASVPRSPVATPSAESSSNPGRSAGALALARPAPPTAPEPAAGTGVYDSATFDVEPAPPAGEPAERREDRSLPRPPASEPRSASARSAPAEEAALRAVLSVSGSLRPHAVVSATPTPPDRAPTLTPVAPPTSRYTAPVMQNPAALRSQIANLLSPSFLERNQGGTVTVVLSIDEQGRVTASELAASSGHPELDRVTLRAVQRMRFEPAQRNGLPVGTRIRLPLVIEP